MKPLYNDKTEPELIFENEVIKYLTNIGGVKQWQYEKGIKTNDQLWDNFKKILEQNNRSRIDKPLSHEEFSQVKKVINSLDTPYKAGQFLYGVNGVSEVEVDLDDGRHVFLTVFDQSQVGGGNTVYQIVNQIERPKVIDGKPNRRFDVTMLINGLPIIQIELKKAMHSTNEALNQMNQYIDEKQYGDIYSTLQVLVAMTPYETKYMANTISSQFNKAFAFNWQNEKDSKPVYNWKEFADKVLSIPMAHELSTRYMILDGTKNKECIKVMRPYQVYATKNVLTKIRKHNFSGISGKLGYIWHTTGSGKTITSFKTAWLASRLPNVDKVVFLVDRIALTNQTSDAYRAYDPTVGVSDSTGIINDTENTKDLYKKLRSKSDKNIIVTSIQKMSKCAKKYKESLKKSNENILFIVDEAHRSTGDGKDEQSMLEVIRTTLPRTALVGYTGTPKFPETENIFGEPLHLYTIKEAIADKNVLGFNVEFKTTIAPPENPNEEEIDDNIKASIYDKSEEHIKLVVEDILNNWKTRSNNRKYNGLFTVHVCGTKASIPRAMEYFNAFIKENEKRPLDEQIKVAISFSMDTSNGDNQLDTNKNLLKAMKYYNKMFGTNFDMSTTKEYTSDLASRLNKTVSDKKYLDLVIVVDQLLTGFDAPELNTLYIDRTLKGANLIQAYSRTNRIHNLVDKPWGNVINYRWPRQNEEEMNKAFAVYSNKDSAARQRSMEDLDAENRKSGITSKKFKELQEEIKAVVSEIKKLTEDFSMVPPSEKDQERLLTNIEEYNSILSKMKQHTEDGEGNSISAYENPEEFYKYVGIDMGDEIKLTTTIREKLENVIRERGGSEEYDINSHRFNLEMVHIHKVRIDYDYLIELIARMADEVYTGNMDKATKTKEEIDVELAKSENESEKVRYRAFTDKIFSGEYKFESYPAPRNVEDMNAAIEESITETSKTKIVEFIRMWGLDNVVNHKEMKALISTHKIGSKDDLDKKGKLSEIIRNAKDDYKEIASEEVKKLSWIQFLKRANKAVYELADYIIKSEI